MGCGNGGRRTHQMLKVAVVLLEVMGLQEHPLRPNTLLFQDIGCFLG